MDAFNISQFNALKHWTDKKWVVLAPTGKSELGDILFQGDAHDLALQVFGGLSPNRILLVTNDEAKAEKMARVLLTVQKGDFTIHDLANAIEDAHQDVKPAKSASDILKLKEDALQAARLLCANLDNGGIGSKALVDNFRSIDELI
jgi:hypothetical protein